jgi:hypothetical protein
MVPVQVVEEILPSGLKYTEETGRIVRSFPMRDCFLWQPGVDEPISGLNVSPFRQRFGGVAVPSEGIGGVETLPDFRRRGHMRTLLQRAISGISQRVPVVFLSDGIQDTYEQFGFTNCLAESCLSLRVRDVESLIHQIPASPLHQLRAFTSADLPAMTILYNQVHAHRSWTHERRTDWNQLQVRQTWQPGSEVIVLEQDGLFAGYAIFEETLFGHPAQAFTVDELTARDASAARALLVEIAARCWKMRFGEFQVREPLDSNVGKVAQRTGCTNHQTFPPSGGMMGMILDRQQLLALLEPELRRRLPETDLQSVHPAAYDALYSGEIISDKGALLRLLTGYWSATQARAFGVDIPPNYARVVEAWFPGGGTPQLPQPYSHILDRY